MASFVLVCRFIFAFLLLGLHAFRSSGTLVGFSYDAGEEIASPLSSRGAIFKIFMEYLPSSDVSMSLCMNQHELMQILESKDWPTPWHRHNLLATLTELNIDSVIVRSNGLDVPSLISALTSLRASLKIPGLGDSTRISVMFSLSTLGTLHRTRRKSLQDLMQVLKEWESRVVVEAPVVGELSLGDQFVHSTVKMALSSCTYLPLLDVPTILVLKISENPEEVDMVKFVDLVSKFLKESLGRGRIFGLFIDLSNHRQSKVETLGLKEELKFPSSHRVLLDHGRMLVTSTKTTIHDMYPPFANPVTTPITIPSTNPAPAVVTVPSTNPVTVFPTNPTVSPVTVPPWSSVNPVSTPITVPATNPYPTLPVTNPTTTPATYPMTPPVTNPATGYPFTSPVTPSTVPPFTVPSTVPFTPAVTGQTWCVAKSGVTDAALQIALDYACGIVVADCSTIQPTGSCYYPDSLQAHASYAFNSYYQRNPVPTSCDFGGTAMLVNVNPSSGTCNYPASSSSSSSSSTSSLPAYNPSSTTPGSTPGSGSSVLNTNSPSGSNSIFGSNNPTSTASNARSRTQSARWTYLAFVPIVAYISYVR
ncbi:mucin-2-like [Zingiber officinale]|uniref:X8 domain-containing protein n=1 Tax=Zingiber officinale TaxID=94328 RepID=A0A8J5KK59_ZINOF|nr:mucin-2-like [Zingiber officinale]KAG6486678.1 hypothetical protein ZIOFF_055257 [Zingiber officinale]